MGLGEVTGEGPCWGGSWNLRAGREWVLCSRPAALVGELVRGPGPLLPSNLWVTHRGTSSSPSQQRASSQFHTSPSIQGVRFMPHFAGD